MGVDNHYYLGCDWKVNWKLNESILLQKVQFLLFTAICMRTLEGKGHNFLQQNLKKFYGDMVS